MPQHATLNADLTCWHAPILRGRLHQHGPRGRARLAQLLVGVGDRRGTSGALNAHQGVLIEIGVSGGVLRSNLGPISIQLLSDQRGEPGERALPELDMLHEHGDRVVTADPHEGVGSKGIG
jgi:hypothetical protein